MEDIYDDSVYDVLFCWIIIVFYNYNWYWNLLMLLSNFQVKKKKQIFNEIYPFKFFFVIIINVFSVIVKTQWVIRIN